MGLSTSDRFTSRVRDYVRYRPGYPVAATEALLELLAVDSSTTVADIGAGTGLLTLPLARSGARVVAIDPNREMLAAARVHLRDLDNVEFVEAPAEETGLPSHSVDAIAVGQAFHWFDLERAREEFLRILVP